LSLYEQNGKFEPYIAQCLWSAGKFEEALNKLRECYATDNVDIKNIVKGNYRKIVEDTISNRSEAILAKITAHARTIFEIHKDPTILLFVWSDCFLSDWFCDRQFAGSLFKQYVSLRVMVGKDMDKFAFLLLQHHNIDAIHRLIEQCLAFDMKAECRICMTLLFDYQYWRSDLRACAEIMKNSLELSIPLSSLHNQKLLRLMLKKPKQPVLMIPAPKVPTPKFKFKF